MSNPDVVVVGAGITGLTCAYRLKQLGLEPLVLEAGSRAGGVIRTEEIDGHLVEWGPSSLVPTPHTFEFLDEIGLTGELYQADPRAPRYVVIGGRLRAVPLGVLSIRGMARAVLEPTVRSKSADNESVADFFRRRFGTEVHDRLAAPFVTGIFAGDTEKLSVAAVFPRIVDVEKDAGSILLGMFRRRPPAARAASAASASAAPRRKGTVSSLAGGLETLPRRLARDLRIQTECSGIRIGKEIEAKATVLALPAYGAAEIVRDLNSDLASVLDSIEYAPIVVAASSLQENSLPTPLRGFGFLVPQSERLNILGTVFNSLLFADRAPKGRLLLTSFLGGALKPEAFDWPEERLWDVVGTELKHVLKSSLRPDPLAVIRYRRAIPQYNIGHSGRIEAIAAELRRHPGLFITGNFLHGVSVPACMEHGDSTARAVAEFLKA